LCTAGHTTDEVNNAETSLIIGDIVIKKNAWIGTRAFIGLGVEIGEGAIVGATASVYKDVEPWTIVGGNPAKFIKKRVIRDE
jgi:putative colanic acid biosynthesis acetyltransferase WcaF